jgi:NitT/TauT family transport system permease protein
VAWATLVASELIAAQRGLGAMIQNASTYFLLDVIYVGIICIGFIALIPLVIVYLGIGEVAKIAILFYASFFAAVIVMYEGMTQISPVYIRVARTLGATDFEIFTKVMLPMTVPHMLTALRVALGVAWATLVASDLVAAQQGLGAMIQNASAFFDLGTIYLGIICIGALALAMDLLLRRISKRLVAWQDKVEG